MSYHQRTEIVLSMKLLVQMLVEQKYEPIIGFRPFNGRVVPAKYPGCKQHSFLVVAEHIERGWFFIMIAFDVEIDMGILLACEQDAVVAYGGYNVKIITVNRIIHTDSTLLPF